MRAYDPESVEPRLARIVSELARIREACPETVEEFVSDEPRRYELEYRLLIVLQALLDVAAHVALRQGLLTLGTYREAIEQLGRKRIISPELAGRLEAAPGLRNALTHAYLELDAERVYAALRDVEVVEAFVAALVEWTDAQGN